MPKSAALTVATLLFAATGAHAAQRLDEAGVRAAETAWSEAVLTGDTATLEALLDPRYVSINAKGVARPKAAILDFARGYAAKHPGQHATPLGPTSTVQLIGTTALVRHRAPSELSMDLFEFRRGAWIALYSQHTAIAPPPG
jgi:Domain of unknown function (DUF4440)